jgi:hypothetical protein
VSVPVYGQAGLVAPDEPLLTTSVTLRAGLDRIASGSPLWREAIAAVRRSGRRALVLTPAQVVVAKASNSSETTSFDPRQLAEVFPVVRDGVRVDSVLVVVNLPLIEDMHQRNRSLPIESDADLDRILIHEVYGHALPYLLAGDVSGRCPDPEPKQRASDACSIRRENAVRAELGLGRRLDYGLAGLLLSRPGWR